MLRLRAAQPPLRRPALDAVTGVLQAATARNESAWAFAVRSGAYQELVRCMDAHADDPDLQALCCTVMATLAHKGVDGEREFWPGHVQAAVQAGSVRAILAALHAHGARCNELLATANALEPLVAGDAGALAEARDGRAAEALARALPLALRSAAVDDTLVLEVVIDTLGALARLDDACAQQAAACPGTLAALASALRLHGGGSHALASSACFATLRIVAAATAEERAAAADGCLAALRATAAVHEDVALHADAWACVVLLLADDERAIKRAGAAGLAADAVRKLRSYVGMTRNPEHERMDMSTIVIAAACTALSVLTRSCEPNRHAAHAAGAVPALVSVLRTLGAADAGIAMHASDALSVVLRTRLDSSHADDTLHYIADVAAVMRAHASNENVQRSAASALVHLVMPLLLFVGTAAARRAGAPDAAEHARHLANAGVLDAAAAALRAHAAAGPEQLREDALTLLVMVCSGALFGVSNTPLQASVAAHAARAGVGAALAAASARTPPLDDAELLERAAALAAAVARLPAPLACDGCGTTEAAKLLRCARCRTARFCSAACQRASWAVHKRDCVAPEEAAADGA